MEVKCLEECDLPREESGSPSKGVALEHTLTCMLAKNFDDTTALVPARDIPLEVPSSLQECCIELVRNKLIRKEDPE